MMKIFKTILLLPFVFISLVGCVKEVDESDDSVQRRIVQAYIKTHYGDLDSTASGMYIINTRQGSGKATNDSSFVFVRYSIKSLAGEYLETTYDSIAKQLGTYQTYNYYGTYTWGLGLGEVPEGVNELLLTMREGDKSIGIIPPWLLKSNSTSLYQEEDGITKIYEVELVKVVENIRDYQFEELQKYADKYYGGMDSTHLGFYYKDLYVSTSDTCENNSTINVRYIAKLLNGQVFDTNVADTAKKYRFYDSSSSYTAMDISFYTSIDEMISNNSAVNGFVMAINKMKYGDKAVTFFYSNYGYEAAGSMTDGKGVPPYSPICFEIWVEEEE